MAPTYPTVRDVMSISEAARRLGVSRTWIVTLIANGGLVQHNIAGGVKVVESKGVRDMVSAKEAKQ